MKPTFFTLCIWLMFLLSLEAQMPIFTPFLTKELADMKVTTIYQDKDAWIWLGTNNGLVCYDGVECRYFQLGDSTDSQMVTAIFEWKGRLMVGFRNGNIGFLDKNTVFWYDVEYKVGSNRPQERKLEAWSPSEGTPSKSITNFCADSQGNLWFSTYGEGLYCFKNERLYQFDAADDQLAGDEIYTLSADKNGQVWAGTDKGISICSINDNLQKKVQNIATAEGLPDEIVLHLSLADSDEMWVGMDQNGWVKINTKTLKIVDIAKDWQHGALAELAHYIPQEIWCGTAENGLIRCNILTNKTDFLPENHPLRDVRIQKIWKDQEGLLWVINEKGVIFRGNPQFSLLPIEVDNVQTLWVDDLNRVWSGTEKGLFVKENAQNRLVLAENTISLQGTDKGCVLVGTFGKGLFIFDATAKLVLHINEEMGLPNDNILSIAYNDGKIWLATLGGVTEVVWSPENPSKHGEISLQADLGNSYVYKVFVDSKKKVWFGTDGNGLVVFEKGQFKQIGEDLNPSLKTIFSIEEDPKGNIWFTSDRQGLYCFDGKDTQHFTEKNGLHGLQINGLAVNLKGELVIFYANGLNIFSTETKHCTYYEVETGLPLSDFALNAVCYDPQGQIWAGGKKGILQLNTYRESFNIDPVPHLRSVSLFLKPLDFIHKKSFNYTENYFLFDIMGLWFTNPLAVQYRYKLDGFDPNWKITKDNKVSYPNLPPGNYSFRVQASEHLQFDTVQETKYNFTIHPPFYTRWWFLLGLLLFVGFLLRKYINYREKRLQNVAQLQKEKAESQFETLKSQINPHFLFNSFNTLTTIIDENPQTAIQYVENLSDFYRNMLVYRDKVLITVQEELEMVQNFEFLLKKRYEDNLIIQIDLAETKGMIMPLTLQLLVENAVKHNIISKAKPLKIEVFSENNTYIVVKNNFQPKMTNEEGTQFGLQSLQHRYKLLKRKEMLVLKSEEDFVVKVPIF
jgi:ligand-binding sensor domain-containing protein